MVKKIIKGSALAAAALFLFLAAAPEEVYGALGIETGKTDCSIRFDLGTITTEGSDYAELTELQIPVNLYKVADVEADGSYTLDKAYSSLSKDLKTALDAANVQEPEKAEQWLNLAAGIGDLIPEEQEGDYSITVESGEGIAENLPVGLYLVRAGKVWSAEYIYTFSPYLISVPDNAYYRDEEKNDDWIYEVEVSLKPERQNRLGDLEIRKTLNSYNATLQSATFIFQIDAQKDDIVYSDVVSLVFDGTGTRSAVLRQKIPAGAEVTVREVYSGPSYRAEGNEQYTIERSVAAAILEETKEVDENEAPRNVASFTNTYDDRLNGGTSVVNHFKYAEDAPNGPWLWEQQDDSSGGEQEHE